MGLVSAVGAHSIPDRPIRLVSSVPSSVLGVRSSRDGSRRATTARATIAAQISAETATWAARAHVASSVSDVERADDASAASTSSQRQRLTARRVRERGAPCGPHHAPAHQRQ